MKTKKFEIYLKNSMYIEEAESMIDAILKFAGEYPCALSEIVAVVEQCDETTWIKRNNVS